MLEWTAPSYELWFEFECVRKASGKIHKLFAVKVLEKEESVAKYCKVMYPRTLSRKCSSCSDEWNVTMAQTQK